VISGFHQEVDEIYALLGYCSVFSANSLQTLRDILSVRFSLVKIPSRKSIRRARISWPLKMGPIGCPETSVRNYRSTLRNIPQKCRSLKEDFFDCLTLEEETDMSSRNVGRELPFYAAKSRRTAKISSRWRQWS